MVWGLFRSIFKKKNVVEQPRPVVPLSKQETVPVPRPEEPLYKQPTEPMSAREIAKRRHSLETEAVKASTLLPILPRDQEGRPFIKICNPYEPTLLLLTAAVGKFCKIEQAYPEEIRLTRARYLTQPGRVYSTAYGEVKIKCVCDEEMNCDVLIRGKVRGAR